MNIALRTTFHRATARRSARVTATAPCGSKLTIPWPDEPAGHRRAADGLRDKLGLSGSLVGGQLGDGSFVFVFAPAVHPDLRAAISLLIDAIDNGDAVRAVDKMQSAIYRNTGSDKAGQLARMSNDVRMLLNS